jgi:hypothetical protein
MGRENGEDEWDLTNPSFIGVANLLLEFQAGQTGDGKNQTAGKLKALKPHGPATVGRKLIPGDKVVLTITAQIAIVQSHVKGGHRLWSSAKRGKR